MTHGTRPEVFSPTMARRVLALLAEIESGAVTVRMVGEHRCHTDVEFVTSNGWRVVVFDDGGFDYIDNLTAPDGARLDMYPNPPEFCCDDYSCERCAIRNYRSLTWLPCDIRRSTKSPTHTEPTDPKS